MLSSSCCFHGEHLRHATEYDARVVTGFEIEKCEGKRKFLTPGVMLGFLTASLLETVRQRGLQG